ncbi:putative receptor-like cytosolic serine/threonine-protein kinase RBK1 isoform X1 [Iris pallida]|uniref:Receptor-like cytosolic serine/threonine-protein kinase RBK1 isoform X1 n=1 Tax=Iris pallida TaxID=29817 RepID=A0AAX6F7J0_IRIPA|nr:putative receptor-like cytosolic serine/threonine-protein kinase RBK1 isoform X1 [Iris pallida]
MHGVVNEKINGFAYEVSEDEISFLTSLNYFLSLKGSKVTDSTPKVFGVRVKAVDTTSAGDAFMSGFLRILSSDLKLFDYA